MKHFNLIDDETTMVEFRENIITPISLHSIKTTPESIDEALQEKTEVDFTVPEKDLSDDEEPTRDEKFIMTSSKNNLFTIMKNFAVTTYDNFKSVFR